MKKLLPILAATLLYACGEIQEQPSESDTGFLSLGIGIDIEQESASGRLENVVNTDDFLIEIYSEAGALQTSFDPFSSAPAQIELPTGTYYVTASSNNLVDAAFDNPYYFGQSDNFTIDKEENKSVDVVVSLANTKVKVNYSQNVLDNFTRYFGSVTVVSSNVTLDYNQGDSRPGYFVSGEDLQVNVTLEYDKAFETNTVISRSLTATIPAALPKTQYNINVDAALVDGQIAINIIVDDSFDEIDIDLTEIAPIYKSCKEILTLDPSAVSGIYTIDPDGAGGTDPYECRCDMTTQGGGWTLVWSKNAGSTGHPAENINWNDALNRIPVETENVYTGLNIWNALIEDQVYGEIMYRWAPPSGDVSQAFTATLQKFNASDNYTLRITNYNQFTGTQVAGIFDFHVGIPFSTVDRDNDEASGSCSIQYTSQPFWYRACWSGSVFGTGPSSPNSNGAYWFGSSPSVGTSNGIGYGDGFLYVR